MNVIKGERGSARFPPAWPGEAPCCKQSGVAMATNSSTFNFSVYEGGNYFPLYVYIVYNSNNVAPTSQVRQLLVINEQLDILIYFFSLLRAFEFPEGF